MEEEEEEEASHIHNHHGTLLQWTPDMPVQYIYTYPYVGTVILPEICRFFLRETNLPSCSCSLACANINVESTVEQCTWRRRRKTCVADDGGNNGEGRTSFA